MHKRLGHTQPLPHAQGIPFDLIVNPVAQAHQINDFLQSLLADPFMHPGEMDQILIARQILVHLRIFHYAAHQLHSILKAGVHI
ncbi:hypothetical protein D3C81_1923670 [compost metagenome]